MRLLVIGLDPATLDPSSRSSARQIEYYRGYDVDIVVVAPGPRTSIQLTPTIRVQCAGGSSWFTALTRTTFLLFRLRWMNQFDVLTVQDPLACGLVGYLAILGTKTRFHLQDHSAYFSRSPKSFRDRIFGVWARFIARRADRVRTVSQRGKRGLESIGIPSDKIDVVSVSTDVSRFEKVVHTSSDHPRLLCVARLSYEKGVDVLLDAFRFVLDTQKNATLTIVGDGPERAILERRAQSLNLGSSVIFAGHQTNLETFFSDADIYVQPSRFEGWGLAVIEAAADGVPIVMTDVGCA